MRFDPDIKIYVAGHNGLVGSEIVSQLKAIGYRNIVTRTSKELDLRNQQLTDDFFSKEQPELVYLAAAKVGGIVANNTYKGDFIYDNTAIALNVINASKKYGVVKLLNLGSSCIYPKFAEQPIKETELLKGDLEPTNEPYAIAKITAIKLCKYYNFQYGTNFISLMPTNLYGKNDNFNFEHSHVLPALIRKFVLGNALQNDNFELIKRDLRKYRLGFGLDENISLDDNDSITMALHEIGIEKGFIKLWGSGNPLREFLYVEDLAEAAIYFMDNCDYNDIGEFINIGSGREISIFDLANLIKEIVNYNGDLIFDITKPDGTPRKFLDISKAISLGWSPRTQLEKGITEVVNYYKSNI